MNKIDFLYHITKIEDENFFKSNELKPHRMNDINYDKDLTNDDAPLGLCFTASLYYGFLPTRTLYPRCGTGYCEYKDMNVLRVKIKIDGIKFSERYITYQISKYPTSSYTQHLFFCVDKNDAKTLEWFRPKTHFEIHNLTQKNPLLWEDENGKLHCGSMNDKLVINIVFTNCPRMKEEYLFDKVTHRCPRKENEEQSLNQREL